jgi:hypothetical protein
MDETVPPEIIHSAGKPLVFRISLNPCSSGKSVVKAEVSRFIESALVAR